MKKTTLALPLSSLFVRAFIAEASQTERTIIRADFSLNTKTATPSPQEQENPEDKEQEELRVSPIPDVLEWNPGSITSTKALILDAETKSGGRFDEVLIVVDPPHKNLSLQEINALNLENTLLDWIAGNIEFLKESAKHLEKSGGGTIILVITDEDKSSLGSLVVNAMLGFAEAILLNKSNNVRLTVIHSESVSQEVLARQIVKFFDEAPKNNTKIQHIGGKRKLFGK